MSLAFAAAALVSLMAPQACSQTPQPPVVIPLEMRGDAALVAVSVNDTKALLILDTGSGVSVLDSAFARQAALAMNGPRMTVAGTKSTSMRLGTAKTVRLGDAELSDILVAPMSFSAVQARLGQDVRGSIGYELFTRWVVDIDFVHRTVTLRDRREFSYNGSGVVLPIRVENRHPVADVSVVTRRHGTLAAKMVLDLGSSSYALRFSTPYVNAHGLAEDSSMIAGPFGAGADGVSEGLLTRFPQLRLGGLTIERPSAALSHDETGAFGSGAQADGTVGMPVFKRTRMIIDYARSRVIFEPVARLDVPDTVTTSGLSFVRDGVAAPLRVAYVIAGSPGDSGGVRAGDEVIQIDDARAEALMVHEAGALLRASASVHRLRLRRGDRTFDVAITPRVVF
jgi:aspartyl protease/PDZ domain-containing protein